MPFCVTCHKAIDPRYAFCVLCGADNRPPENRPEYVPHHHDFTKGPYCPYCGASYSLEGRRNPEHGYVFRNFTFAGGLFFLAFILLMWGWFGADVARNLGRHPQVSWAVSISVAALIALIGVLIQSRVMIDTDLDEIRIATGLWPWIHVERHPFSQARGVQLEMRLVHSRYGSRMYFRVNLLMVGKTVFLHDYSSAMDAYDKAQDLSVLLNVPIQDMTGMRNPANLF